MVFYLVQGTADKIYPAFAMEWAIAPLLGGDSRVIVKDLPRTPFLGTAAQAMEYARIWQQQATLSSYAQGNMDAGNLAQLLGPEPLRNEDDDDKSWAENFASHRIAYLSDSQETAGLAVIYRHDNPAVWMIGHIQNTHALPEDRVLILLSSFDLAPYIKRPVLGVDVLVAEFLDPRLMSQLDAAAPQLLLNKAFTTDGDKIALNFARIYLLMRFLRPEGEDTGLKDPLDLATIDVTALFAENPALDLLLKLKIRLSTAMLQECLLPDSVLCKELLAFPVFEEHRAQLEILIKFYEHKVPAWTQDESQLIADTMQKYPLLASTLIALNNAGADIYSLYNCAFNPQEHLVQAIKYHFFSGPEEEVLFQEANLSLWSAENLEAASKALIILKCLGLADAAKYRRVLEDKRFQKIIQQVEEQCQLISERLQDSEANPDILLKWGQEEADYRKTIYELAYQGLLDPKSNWKKTLAVAEKRMLHSIDPPIGSFIYKALVLIANLVIALVTLGLALYLNGGTFFNRTAEGKILQNMDHAVTRAINSPG